MVPSFSDNYDACCPNSGGFFSISSCGVFSISSGGDFSKSDGVAATISVDSLLFKTIFEIN